MKTQEALVSNGRGQYHVVQNAELPTVRPGTVLCKVHAVALNPVDAKMVDYSPFPGAVGGSDFAGKVVEVGEGVTKFQRGDRVFAMLFGLNPLDKTSGAFTQYTLAQADLACKIPDWMSYAEGSTFGVGVATAGMALFQKLKLPLPGTTRMKKPFPVLVNGGATATGSIAIQLLKWYVITSNYDPNLLTRIFFQLRTHTYRNLLT